jgi:hypothetical protein
MISTESTDHDIDTSTGPGDAAEGRPGPAPGPTLFLASELEVGNGCGTVSDPGHQNSESTDHDINTSTGPGDDPLEAAAGGPARGGVLQQSVVHAEVTALPRGLSHWQSQCALSKFRVCIGLWGLPPGSHVHWQD